MSTCGGPIRGRAPSRARHFISLPFHPTQSRLVPRALRPLSGPRQQPSPAAWSTCRPTPHRPGRLGAARGAAAWVQGHHRSARSARAPPPWRRADGMRRRRAGGRRVATGTGGAQWGSLCSCTVAAAAQITSAPTVEPSESTAAAETFHARRQAGAGLKLAQPRPSCLYAGGL